MAQTTYTIRRRWQTRDIITTVSADSQEAAYDVYARDEEHEPLDRDDVVIAAVTDIRTAYLSITIDPEHDLVESGRDRDEADDVMAAYRGAMDAIAEQLGLHVSVVRVRDGYQGPQTHDGKTRTMLDEDDDEPLETTLWQLAWDCCYHDGAEWQWTDDRIRTQIAHISRRLESREPR